MLTVWSALFAYHRIYMIDLGHNSRARGVAIMTTRMSFSSSRISFRRHCMLTSLFLLHILASRFRMWRHLRARQGWTRKGLQILQVARLRGRLPLATTINSPRPRYDVNRCVTSEQRVLSFARRWSTRHIRHLGSTFGDFAFAGYRMMLSSKRYGSSFPF